MTTEENLRYTLDEINDKLSHGPNPNVTKIGHVLQIFHDTKTDENVCGNSRWGAIYPVHVSNNPESTTDVFTKHNPKLAANGYNNILLIDNDTMLLRYSF